MARTPAIKAATLDQNAEAGDQTPTVAAFEQMEAQPPYPSQEQNDRARLGIQPTETGE